MKVERGIATQAGTRLRPVSQRVGKQVKRDYYGRGAIAEIAADLVEEIRDKQVKRASSVATRLAALDRADEAFSKFDAEIALLATAHLVAAGFYRHDRGPWRKRRHGPDSP